MRDEGQPSMLGLTVVTAVLHLLRLVPLTWAWQAGALLGYGIAALPLRDVRRCRQHLGMAFPEWTQAELSHRTRGCFRHFGATALWTVVAWQRDARDLRRGIAVEGAQHLRELARATRAGQGTVVYTGHLGNWELLARTFATVVPSSVIGRRLRSPLVDALVQRQRTTGGAEVIYQDADIRSIVRVLRAPAGSTRLVATLADQDVPQLTGTFVPWFGRLAFTPVAPAAVAVLARAAVMPVFLLRRHGRWVVHGGPRVQFPRTADRDADHRAITAWATSYEEALVRGVPTQWVWWHKRWRTRPSDEAPNTSDSI